MVRYVANKQLGIARAPNCYSLFQQSQVLLSRKWPIRRRLSSKTPVSRVDLLRIKWLALPEPTKEIWRARARVLANDAFAARQSALAKRTSPERQSSLDASITSSGTGLMDAPGGLVSSLVWMPSQIQAGGPLTRILRWCDADQLGSGSYGQVVRVRDDECGNQFALKLA